MTFQFEVIESPTYLDSAEFKAYVEAIRDVLTREMTVGDIHRALRDKKQPQLTMDALEALSSDIDCDEKIPSRYYPTKRRKFTMNVWDNTNTTMFDRDKYKRARTRGVLDSGIN